MEMANMWNDIQFDPKQVSPGLRRRCEYLKSRLHLYDSEVFIEMEDARHLYGSLKAEGSTLSFVETSMILSGEIPADAKNRDVLEGIALSDALKEVRYLLSKNVTLSEDVVKRIHKTCSNGLLHYDECGEYRQRQNYIGRGNYLTAAPNQIPKLIRRLFSSLEHETNPIIRAAFFGFNYVSIHPFIDFNGRTSRLFECYLLGEQKFPFISLFERDIKEYLTLLQEGQEIGKSYYEPYINFICKRVEERFEEINA